MKTNEHPIELVQKCCAEYYDGKPVTEISKENQVARCTIYRWLKQYKNLASDLIPTQRALNSLRQKTAADGADLPDPEVSKLHGFRSGSDKTR